MKNKDKIPTVSYEDYISAIAILKKTGTRSTYGAFKQKKTSTPSPQTLDAVMLHLENGEPINVLPPSIDNKSGYAQFLSAATTLRDEGDYWSFTAPDSINGAPPSSAPEPSKKDLKNAENYLRGKPMPIDHFLK